ncbi:MAG: hypothetical protein G01um101420_250 [Parcubacteria group bacterium Gr01-1014_20]|nr:MAG: hypothetical protein G01um101420_250 [Parcubacteria group bacterium Gr01-1014_20]
MKYFIYAVITIVGIAVIAGFFIVGSPGLQRLRRLDETRISDLQSIQSEVIFYWQSKEKLPAKLEDLTDQVRGYKAPSDPETNLSYEYEIKGEKTFALCANFSLSLGPEGNNAAIPIPARGYSKPGFAEVNWNWEHTEGRSCFERTIDADYFPLIKDQKTP